MVKRNTKQSGQEIHLNKPHGKVNRTSIVNKKSPNSQNNLKTKQTTEVQVKKPQVGNNSSSIGNKISLERPESGTQQKLVFNTQSTVGVNKEKLQASLGKSNYIQPKSPPPTAVQTIKSSSSSFQPPQQLNQHQIKLTTNQPFSHSTTELTTTKKTHKSKLQYRQSTIIEANGHGGEQSMNKKKAVQVENNESEEETAETVEESERKEGVEKGFLKTMERLEIQDIMGVISADEQQPFDNTLSSSYFMIKSRFHNTSRIIPRQRILTQQPQKLIEFYQQLIMESTSSSTQ